MTTATLPLTARLHFSVLGRPVPQGTVRSLGKGRPSIHGNAATLLPWRQSIAHAAAAAAAEQGWSRFGGPVEVEVRFFFDRPLGHFGKKGLRPSAPVVPYGRGVGDLDKLIRGFGDAITDSGAVWLDDSQVTHVRAWKSYVLPTPLPGVALDRPGLICTVTAA